VPSEDVPLEDKDLEKLGYTKWKKVDVEAVEYDAGEKSTKKGRKRKDEATLEGKPRGDGKDKAKGNEPHNANGQHTDKARKTKKGHLQPSKRESSRIERKGFRV
jgi:hypothetical protein